MRALAMAVCLCLAPVAAAAQLPDPPTAPTEADVSVARDAYVEGVGHAERRRWARALEAFERSYRLSGSNAALFNLGSTLRSLSRFREAREAFERLLADPALDAETRQRAERVRAQASTQIARLTVERVPPGTADVLVDGGSRGTTDARPIEVELDPGPRVVRVELAGHPPWSWSGELGPGARERAEARLDVDAPPPPPPATDDDGTDWTPMIAAVVVLAALAVGGLVVGLAVDASSQLDPRTELVIRLP